VRNNAQRFTINLMRQDSEPASTVAVCHERAVSRPLDRHASITDSAFHTVQGGEKSWRTLRAGVRCTLGLLASVGRGELGCVMNETLNTLGECRQCGLLQGVPEVPHGAVSACIRCDATFHQSARHALPLALACSGLGVFLFALAFWLPVANVVMSGGRSATSDLFTGPELLRQAGAWQLSVVVVVTLLVLPGFELFSILVMGLGVWLRNVPLWVRRCFAVLPALSSWAMVEVFMLGATISLVRLRAWMHVEFGSALFALGGVALCSIGVSGGVDRRALWASVPLTPTRASNGRAGTVISCAGCELVGRFEEGAACPRCSQTLHTRKRHSLSRTSALVLTAALLAIPANLLPVMTIIKGGVGGPRTIFGGTVELVQNGFWILAVLVFTASIVVPLVKLVALCILLISTWRSAPRWLELRTKVFRAVSFIGRWSMLDIFATMTLVELARFGWLGSVRPGPGAIAFCAVVVLTMLASDAFDPRLMWDAAGENQAPVPRAYGGIA
jgi:paraquat-inducible protein A